MEEDIKVGNSYVGTVTGDHFKVLWVGKRHPTARIEVKFSYGKLQKTVTGTLDHVKYLIRKGGIVSI